jgi:hypothetical protein
MRAVRRMLGVGVSPNGDFDDLMKFQKICLRRPPAFRWKTHEIDTCTRFAPGSADVHLNCSRQLATLGHVA